MNTHAKRGKTRDGIHAPTRAELEDLFRPPVIALAIASIRDETLEEDEERGCWHYDYDGFCVTCDPDTYEPSDDEDGGEA